MRWRSVWAGLGAVVLLVLSLHLWALGWLAQALDSAAPPRPSMQRMQASYTRVVRQSAPPTGAAAPAPAVAQTRAVAAPKATAQAAPVKPAASAVPPPEAASAVEVAQAASAPEPAQPASAAVSAAASAVASAASAESAAASGVVSGAASAPAVTASAPGKRYTGASGTGPVFTWPASTRLTYAINGWYRGEVYGDATVEWLRQGERYQVHLDASLGPRLAPLFTRRMSSEGLITAAGLRPQRYEQVTRQLLGRQRTVQVEFPDDTTARLPDGRQVNTQADVQDTASQFIQMVYLFSTQPQLRQLGGRVEFDLAFPHRIRRWAYEVGERVPTPTPVGELETFHVRPVPVRDASGATEAVTGGAGILSVQIWYAPTLQMLPVRIRIEQDAQTWMNLVLTEAPQQAE